MLLTVGDQQSVDQLTSFFHVATWDISCSVIMPIRLPAICDYHQTRSPLEKGLLEGDYLTWAFMPLRRVVPLRGTLSCAFGAALLQGPTRGDYLTWAFMPLRRIVPLRGTPSCAFGAALLQGPTRGDYLTWAFMPLRRVVPLRGTLSCAFGAALLQGPTRGRNILVPSHSFFISFSDGVK